MSKNKIVVAIIIGIMSFMMIYVMLIQFNIVNEYDGSEIELMRETELKEILASYKAKYEETNEEIITTREKIEEYKTNERSEEKAIELLEQEIKQTNLLLGMTDVQGEGVIIKMENNIKYNEEESSIITSADLVLLINELRLAGAEAISINEERIVANSDLFDVGNFIQINGQRTTSPYTIKAIGDKTYLQSALSIKGGYIDTNKSWGYIIELETQDNIKINKYEGEFSLNYEKKEEVKK